MARNIWPLVQNRNEGEWTKSILRMEISTGPGRVSKMKSAGLFVGVCVQRLSSIAPDRRSRSGRDKHQKMRQSSGTTMVVVTWRHVSRVTRHVPPREKYAKKF